MHEKTNTEPQSKHEGKTMQQDNSNHYRILQTTDNVSKEELIDLYVSVGFGERRHYEHLTDMVERMFGDGVFGFFVHQDQHLIGMARVYSDDTSVSWIAEIAVRPDRQGSGIGSAILKAVNERFGHTDLYVQPFTGQQPFFVKGGIPARPQMAVCGRASNLSIADRGGENSS
ncbi:GNAT family N-acetyltransferase [Thalassospiraceae bacterium LMO-JJ14]|nr:GNAT family N-acetyltransferase [Thalassospiraceae bacterium LMO-JJ14]